MVLKSMLCAAASTAVLASLSPLSHATRVTDSFATAITVTEIALTSNNGAAADPALPQSWVDEGIRWRSIGPANMGGRVTDIAVNESDPSTFWVATASGGLLKTTNNGATFEHQFDQETTVSIGALAVAQSDPDVLYIGTGEANPRNSVSWGDGVYKSTDGGDTWTHVGLSESFQTGGVVVHPEDPDVVYVGALGRLWGTNDQRGLFKSTDGGENWEKVLYIDDMTGVIDVKMSPADPDTLLVATYERQRDGFDTNDPAKKWGEGSGLYKTVDGGETWQKISAGLPSCKLGRIGIDYYRNDPDTVYIVLESERIGQESPNLAYMGIRGEDADVGARITEVIEDGPADAAGVENGDIIIAFDAETIQSYDDMVRKIRGYSAGDKIVVEVSRNRESVLLDLEFTQRPDADDEEPGTPFGAMLGGQRENIQDRQGEEGNEFGGIYKSTDGGDSWTRINSLNPRPMYFSELRCDPSDDDYLWVLGVSLYRSDDNGETFDGSAGRGTHPDHHAMWIDPNDGRHVILGNDGGIYTTYDRGEHWTHHNNVALGQFYHVTVGPRRNYYVYGGLQDNGSWGGPSRVRSGGGPINEDWISIGGGDGFICAVDANDPDQIYFESQNGGTGRRNLRTGEQGFIRPRRQRGTRYRFNWRTPYMLSSHNSRIYYSAGNYVFRSFDRGNSLKRVSPEITLTERGSATALGESHFDPDILFVGTDDGAFWMTEDGGHNWRPLLAFDSDTSDDESVPEEPIVAAAETTAADDAPAAAPADEAATSEATDRMTAMLKRLDENGDGKITRDEMPERMARFFDRLDTDENGVVDAKEMKAAADRMGAGRASGRRGDDDPPRVSFATQPVSEANSEAADQPETDVVIDDPISGEWDASVQAEGMEVGDESTGFTMILALGKDGKVTGTLESQFNSGDIESGKWNAEDKRLTFSFQGDGMTLDFSGRMRGERMTGTIDLNDGMFSMDWEAKRTKVAAPAQPEGDTEQEDAAAAAAAAAAAEETVAEPKTEVDDAWTTLTAMLPGPRWVSSIEMSRFEEDRVYVTFDGHRSDDDGAYVFVTDDLGKSWKSLTANLPAEAGSTRCLREDIENPNLLYLGTEFGLYASIDQGDTWTRLHGNLPTVAVHEVAIHPTAGEIVAATHGRSLWILDVTALRQMSADTVAKDAHLYEPNTAIYWRSEPSRGSSSSWSNKYRGQNPDSGAQIFYSLGKEAESVNVIVKDLAGETLREFEGDTDTGLHRVSWDLRRQQAQGRGGRFGRGRLARAGTYIVELAVDGETMSERFEVETDPEYPDYRPWQMEQRELAWDLFGVSYAEDEEGESDAAPEVDY